MTVSIPILQRLSVCSVDGPLDPVDVIGDVGVDAGQVLPRAPDAPRDEADEDVAAAHRGHQGAAAVALQRFADVRFVTERVGFQTDICQNKRIAD